MAFSGEISQTVFDTRKVIENAARRCKIRPQMLTEEHVEVANDQLYLLLSSVVNKDLQLWCIEKTIYPLYDGQNKLVTLLGTIDILNANLRTLQEVTGDVTSAPTSWQVEFEDPTYLTTIGLRWDADAVPVTIQTSDDGLAWTDLQAETPQASEGEWTWFDLEAAPAQYFRVLATSGTLDFQRVYLGTSPREIPLARINRDDYTNLPNKRFLSSRPTQYWLDRQVLSPVMNLWPTPNDAAETSQVVVWARRHIMDVGSMTQEIEVPKRWMEAIVSMLAARLALSFDEVDPGMIPILDSKAKEALYFAQEEERDNSPIKILPNISPYTR